MLGDPSDHLLGLFEDQFESDAGGYLYRRYSRDAPIRISAAERAQFVAEFRKGARWLFWTAAVVTVLVIAALGYGSGTIFPGPEAMEGGWIALGVSIPVLIFVFGHFGLWNAPMRSLARRPVLGNKRSRAEMREHLLARQSWAQFGVVAAAPIVGTLDFASRTDLLHGWGRLWLLLIGGGAILFGYATICRLRFDLRRPRMD